MPNIYTYRQIQDRVMRRAGIPLNDADIRESVKLAINETYTDILSRFEEWGKDIKFTTPITFPALTNIVVAPSRYKYIDNVWCATNDGIIHSLDPMTDRDFNRYIKDNSQSTALYPRKYIQTSVYTTDPASSTFMSQYFKIYPKCSSQVIVNFDGAGWPQDLFNDTDKPYLDPNGCYILILGSVAYMLELDEDERADIYSQKYEGKLSQYEFFINYTKDDNEPVKGKLESANLDDEFPNFPRNINP